MSDEPNLMDPLLVIQQRTIQSLVVQVIGAGRGPGGHIKDSLVLLEQVAADVIAKAVQEDQDEATLAEFTDAVRQRIVSLRHPTG